MLCSWLHRIRAAGAREGWKGSRELIAAAYRSFAVPARVPREAASESQAGDLHQALSNAGLSYNATMAVLRAASKRSGTSPAVSDSLLARVRELQEGFGTQVASAILAKEPSLLQRKPATLQAHYAGLVQLLPFEEAEVKSLCVKCPMLLSQNPATVVARIGKLQAMLQVSRESLCVLVRRMPSMLKINVDRLASTVKFLEHAAGVDRARVVRMLLSWPMLGSIGLETLHARHKSIAQLLGGSPADIKRVLASWPNLLVRDHNGLADKMAHLAEVLGLSLDEVRAVMLKEPGLLSYNVGTLKSKYAYITQVLRLPKERALTLLTHNRPLMAVPLEMPHRVEVLCKLLEVPEDEVYPLLHQQMSVLRFPPEAMEAKVKVVAALCALNPSWQQQWTQGTPMLRLRVIQSGWSTIYRLVFLLHTAQPEATTVMNALRAVQQTWNRMHPDYLVWLERYNQAVATQGGHVQLLPLNGGPMHHNKGPATVRCVYEPITPNSLQGWHAGSLFQQDSNTSFAGAVPTDAQADQNNLGGHSKADNSSSSERAQLTAAGAGAAVTDAASTSAVPATRVHLLAHLLHTSADKAAELVGREPVIGKLSWVVLGARLGAIGAVLMQLGRISSVHRIGAPGRAAGGDANGSDTAGAAALSATAGSSAASSSAALIAAAGGEGAVVMANGSITHSNASAAVQAGSAAATMRGTRSRQAPSVGVASAAAGQDMHGPAGSVASPRRLSAEVLYQRHLQSLQQVQLSPPSWAQAALSSAASSAATQPCVASAVALAVHLAPFSVQLWAPPNPQHPAVAELVLLRPSLMRSTTLQQRSAWIQSLAAAHSAIAQHLSALTPERLAAVLSVPRTRLSMLSYLVQTGQPQPWAVPLQRLLSATERYFSPAVFEAAYPGYAAWKAAWPVARVGASAPEGQQPWQQQEQQGHQEQRQGGEQRQKQPIADVDAEGSDGDDAKLAERG